mmetsp:Transcript_3106/g.4195  ORF Transcript_3106/g.4195 Transcript_3106/m.4195 type:complete len:83 (+) Transcript_3106:146-394(+)
MFGLDSSASRGRAMRWKRRTRKMHHRLSIEQHLDEEAARLEAIHNTFGEDVGAERQDNESGPHQWERIRVRDGKTGDEKTRG